MKKLPDEAEFAVLALTLFVLLLLVLTGLALFGLN